MKCGDKLKSDTCSDIASAINIQLVVYQSNEEVNIYRSITFSFYTMIFLHNAVDT